MTTIVITGSTRGLGLETAVASLEQGANVVISSENQADLEQALAQLSARYPQVRGVVCDVTKVDDVEQLAQFTLAQFGQINCWINNAGMTAPSGDTEKVPMQFAQNLFNVNLVGCYYGSVVALRQFNQQGFGRLINITGRGEKGPQVGANLYSSSKAWIRNFTLAIAKEHKADAIEAVTFNPGLLLTKLTQQPLMLKGNEERLLKGLKMVMPIIGDNPKNAGKALANVALTQGKAPLENRTSSFLLTVLKRLLTGKRADVDLSNISPVVIEPELGLATEQTSSKHS